ncbi:LOW QUALITY PROTEIN: hypothetical protein PanWU01x14_322700 [Parasponia andersonii]|uniref:Uncharacterized protein n=1 Tax=Parasponia andersonii TaxID=3476 RepID=A0A2P5AKS8_PARAD|nr:LOW QUALITY PROTEIN: hypothetical protein PanWU01x14_322700 [Parasponia andersonii]
MALGRKKFFGNSIGMTNLAFAWLAFWLDVVGEAAGVKFLVCKLGLKTLRMLL